MGTYSTLARMSRQRDTRLTAGYATRIKQRGPSPQGPPQLKEDV